jgi:hypothetical protein
MAYAKKAKKATAGAEKSIKRAVKRAKAAVKSVAAKGAKRLKKGAKRLKKVATKARTKAAAAREKARLRVAGASQKPAPRPKFAKADAPAASGKPARRAGQPLAGTRSRPRKASPRIIGGVNL